MKTSKLTRVLTLLSFLFLISSFIAYRTGAFEKLLNKTNSEPLLNQEESIIGITPIDSPITTVVDIPQTNPAMLPTAKSTILVDEKIEFKPTPGDTRLTTTKTDSLKLKRQKEMELMVGSKSAVMFKPKIDTTNPSPKK